MKEIPIETIHLDDKIYPRTAGTEWHTVLSYRQAMESGQKFPPVVLTPREEGGYFLIDGWHRVRAWERLGMKAVKATVLRPMSKRAALEESLRRNMAHGRPLTFQDKLEAYRRLKRAGYDLEKVAGILHIPPGRLQKYVKSRIKRTTDGAEIVLKPTVKHLAEVEAENVEDLKILSLDSQLRLIKNLIILVRNGWIERSESVQDAMEELKSLLA